MHISFVQLLALLTTFLIFGIIGFQLSKKFKRPVSILTWIVLLVGTFFARGIMPSAMLVGIFEFKIFVSDSLQALGIGIIIGLVTREIRMRLQTN